MPLLINQSNIFRDFSLRSLKRLAGSDLAVIGLTGIGSIRKISVLDLFFCLLMHHAATIVLLRDVFHIGLVIGPRPAVLT